MTAFYSALVRDDKDQVMSLRFIDNPIPRSVYDRFKNACFSDISFGEIDAEQLIALMHKAKIKLIEPSNENDKSITFSGLDIKQAQSIRRHVIKQYNITNAYRVKMEIETIAAKYKSGKSVLDISRDMRLSPYFIFKNLAEHLHGKEVQKKLNILSLGQARASDLFDARMAHEYDEISVYDFESIAVQLQMAEVAAGHENNFVAFLRDDLGIKLKVQEELFEEAMRDGNHPVTPDALFLSPVEINGVRVRWIDFKAYCGTPLHFLAGRTQLQYAKYKKTYGDGFIVYEHGYVEPCEYPAVSARALRSIIAQGIQHGILV